VPIGLVFCSVQVEAAAPRQASNCAFCRIGAVPPVKGW
jgi:hypothetical protein